MIKYKGKLQRYRLVKETCSINKVKISSSIDINEYIRDIWEEDNIGINESFYVVYLNKANNTVGYKKISEGGLYGTVVDIKLICKYAIESLTASVIICHNHPSGQLNPSVADIRITNKLKESLKLIDVDLLDHIIITEDSYYSLGDNGDI